MTSETITLSYVEAGRGDPVLLLDWTPWRSPSLAGALAEKYRVFDIAPPVGDHPNVTLDHAAMAVARVANSARLDSYALVGASLGADVAFRVALQQPATVSALVLVSPLCVEPASPPPWHTPELAARALLAHPETADAPLPDAARTAELSALSEQWRASHLDSASLLPQISSATLVVFGQEDRLVSSQAGGVWKEQVPNCSLCYVYDAGHAVAVERPDAVVNVVLDFVERRETFIVENRSGLINP